MIQRTRGKQDVELSILVFETCLGWMGVMQSTRGIRRIILPQNSRQDVVATAVALYDPVTICDNPSSFSDLPQRLGSYLLGKPIDFPDHLDIVHATSFQREVWDVTCSIAYGETRSYGWIALQIGKPLASRAIGQALGRNPVPIIIPCHRVISGNGSLGGFTGGLPIKQHLLDMEHTAKDRR